MTGPMHYENRDALLAAGRGHEHPPGTTYASETQIRRKGTDGFYEPTDTPAPCRPDDPPWYREPTADLPGQVRACAVPDKGWEWQKVGVGPWVDARIFGAEIVEVRRIEPEPEPVMVLVDVGLLERLVHDANAYAGHAEASFRQVGLMELPAIEDQIAEARR